MAREQWPLAGGRPCIEIFLTPVNGPMTPRRLLADTGAGAILSGFELVLDERDCLFCSGTPCQPISLSGAYA